MANKVMSARDSKVHVRNSLLSMIYHGVELLNKEGNRNGLAGALKYIHNHYKGGYAVNLQSDYVFDFFGTYTKDDGMIVIEEDGKPLMVIVKLKEGQCVGEWRVYEVDEYDFKDDKTLSAEAQAEMDADNAYEKYLDAKCMYDDPRGY